MYMYFILLSVIVLFALFCSFDFYLSTNVLQLVIVFDGNLDNTQKYGPIIGKSVLSHLINHHVTYILLDKPIMILL